MADTVYQQLRAHLAYLRLTAAAEQLAPALEHAERDKPSYTQFLHDLLAAEVNAVEQRRLQGRLRFAKLPARKTLEQFDFSAQPSLDRRLVEDLATLRFIEEKANVLADRPARRRQDDARHDPRPPRRRGRLPRLLHHRRRPRRPHRQAALEGRWATTMRFWNGPQLLIVDELGYLPMPGEAAAHLFQVISRRYEHGSIILTTNRGIADWGHIFDDTTVAAAILDRLLHHATVLSINGDSYRMRGHRDAIARPPTRDHRWGILVITPEEFS